MHFNAIIYKKRNNIYMQKKMEILANLKMSFIIYLTFHIIQNNFLSL